MEDMPERFKRSMESTKAEYRQLGKSGLKVSVPILGAMSFGSQSWQPWVLEEDKVSRPYGPFALSAVLNTPFRLSQF